MNSDLNSELNTMLPPLLKFSSPAALEEKLRKEIVSNLESSIAIRGYANLAVSGGNTPKALFKALSQQDIAWEKVNVTLVDERVVDPGSTDSNDFLVRTYLLQGFASKANFVSLNPGSGVCDVKKLVELEESIVSNKLVPLDVLILGMGNDGHTASLFPCSNEVSYALDRNNKQLLMCVRPQTAAYERITFTLAALLKSRKVFLHIVGADKLAVLQYASEEASELKMPIRAFLQASALDMTVYWTSK